MLKGTLKITQRDLPFLILEILPVYSLENPNGQYRMKRQDELISILQDIGYSLFRIDSFKGSLIKIAAIEVHGQMENTNYFFAHASRLSLLPKHLFYNADLTVV